MPLLKIDELRGNLDTRLRKLTDGQYDAIIVACAGLRRLGLANTITARISPDECLPAVAQGALALETRKGDSGVIDLLMSVYCIDTAATVAAERALLTSLGGGCSVPVAAYAELDGDTVNLRALVAAPDGSRILKAQSSGHRMEAESVGRAAADRLLELGAAVLLEAG